MADGKISIEIEIRNGKVVESLKDIQRKAAKSGKKTGKGFSDGFKSGSKGLKSSLNNLRGSISAVAGPLLALFGARAIIRAANEQEDAINAMNTALKRSGEFSVQASIEIQEWASALQQSTTAGDEVILSNLALSKSYGATAEQAKVATEAALELSEAAGIAFEEAIRRVGRAMSGSIDDVSKFAPAIKNLTKEQLRAGDAAKELVAALGGTAAAAVNTFSGATSQLGNSVGDLAESFGSLFTKSTVIVAVIKKLSSGFGDMAKFINLAFNPNTNQQIDDLDLKILSLRNRVTELQGVAKGTIKRGFFESILGDDIRLIPLMQKGLRVLQAERAAVIKQQDDANKKNGESTKAASEFTVQLQKMGFAQSEIVMSSEAFAGALNTTNEQAFTPLLASIKALGLSTSELKENLQDPAFVEGVVALNSEVSLSFSALTKSIQTQAKLIKVTNKTIATSFIKGLAGGIGKAFGNIGTSLASGENLFKAFGDSVLGIFGNLLSDMGQGFILQGTARILAGDPGGGALIGAGAAMQIFGGFIGAKSGGAAGASGGGASVTTGGGVAAAPSDVVVAQEEVAGPSTQIAINIQGDVLDSDETSLRIVDFINNAFDKEGAIISRNVRFA